MSPLCSTQTPNKIQADGAQSLERLLKQRVTGYGCAGRPVMGRRARAPHHSGPLRSRPLWYTQRGNCSLQGVWQVHSTGHVASTTLTTCHRSGKVCTDESACSCSTSGKVRRDQRAMDLGAANRVHGEHQGLLSSRGGHSRCQRKGPKRMFWGGSGLSSVKAEASDNKATVQT